MLDTALVVAVIVGAVTVVADVAAVEASCACACACDVVWDERRLLTLEVGGGRCGWFRGCDWRGYFNGAGLNVGAGSSKIGSCGAPGRRTFKGCCGACASRAAPIPGLIARVARLAEASLGKVPGPAGVAADESVG